MKPIPYNLDITNMEVVTPLAPHEVFCATERTADSDIALHRHSFYEILYVIEGSGTHVIGNNTYEFGPGHIALICPYQAHTMIAEHEDGFTYRRCAFDLSLLLKYADDELMRQELFAQSDDLPLSFRCSEDEMRAFEILFDSLDVEVEDSGQLFGSALSASIAIRMLILYLRCRRGKERCAQNAKPDVWDAYRIMHKRSTEDISPEAVAAELGWGADELKAELYESLDASFKDTLAEIRLRNAASLLLVFPDMNVLDIAKNAGFKSGATFFRLFERSYGMTPTAFRTKFLFRSLPSHTPVVPNALFANVVIYVYKNYRDDLKIKQLAKRFKVNDQQLSEEFVRYLGMSFTDLLARVRIKKAIGFLRSTNQPVEIIANEVGYNSGRTFSRTFQKVTGMTPNAFRATRGAS